MTPGWGGRRRDENPAPGAPQVTLSSLLLPLCHQLSSSCNTRGQRAATSPRQKGTPWTLYANVRVCALHSGNCGSLFVCTGERPPCRYVYTCRETRKRFYFERLHTFRDRVLNYFPCFCFIKAKRSQRRQMLRRDAELLWVLAEGRDQRRSVHVGALTCAQLSLRFVPSLSLNTLKQHSTSETICLGVKLYIPHL